ncbi:hypothetical protein QTP70_029106, partial [Hemibagrus guttatus]
HATEVVKDHITVTMAEAVEKRQKDVETIAQLEKENSDLMIEVEILRDAVEDMGKQLIKGNRECEEL